MNCTNCGTAFSSDSSFCANCGTPKQATFTPPPAAAQPATAYSPAAPASPTNGMAIAGLVLSILGCTALIGAILGHVALSQIKRTGQQGRGMAIAAIAVGWSFVGISAIWAVLAGIFAAAAASTGYYY